MKKGQSAVEFVILVGVVLVMFLMFVGIIQGNISDEVRDNRDTLAKEIALTVQNELSLAENTLDGYLRSFTLPANILGLKYDITLTGVSVFIKTEDGKHAVAVSAPNITGNVIPGVNVIQKIDGVVVINS